MDRRGFIVGAAAQAAALVIDSGAGQCAYPLRLERLAATRESRAFVEWMVKNRGENPHFLGRALRPFRELIARHDVWDEADMRAFSSHPAKSS